MQVSIIGSRTFTDYTKMKQELDEILNLEEVGSIISGGAKGADTLAERYANEMGINFIKYVPDWSVGRHAGLDRNTTIVSESDLVICFWDGSSKGTEDSIRKAHKMGKEVKIVYV